jgi:3-phosphoshikimate 1-carboxyvinyltransferase
MNLCVKPIGSYLKGEIVPPGSKSYSIRGFIIAALGGNSKIINPSLSEDVKVAISICRQLGARIARINNKVWQVQGIEKEIRFPKNLNVKESGTTLRFLLSLASLSSRKIIIKAEGTLNSRPNKPLISVLKRMGADINGRSILGTTPISIKKGNVKGTNIIIDGTLSSQFISSLLITTPLLDSDSTIRVVGDYIVSTPYIDMTLAVLKKAGIKIKKINSRFYKIKGRQCFKGLGIFRVPTDYGLSAFLMAAACLTNSRVVLRITSDNLIQADKKIIEFLERMGVKLKIFKNSILINGPMRLQGGNFCCRECPDLVPVLVVLGLFADRATRIYGIGHLRAKESDRITDFRTELFKLGAKVKEFNDQLIIYPVNKLRENCVIDPHNDHRLAMAFAVLGLRMGIIVKNIECVNKSYPDFLRDLRNLGAKIKLN